MVLFCFCHVKNRCSFTVSLMNIAIKLSNPRQQEKLFSSLFILSFFFLVLHLLFYFILKILFFKACLRSLVV